MTSSSDQNLLFGIIALQMDFVRRDQLVAAASTWLTDKSRRVEEILVEQGALSEDDRQLLAPLVARHLENHGGDPRRSLSALSSIGSVASELRSLGDDGIEATLSIVGSKVRDLHAETANHDSAGASPASPSSRDTPGARFRVLRSHAKGGLGEVYVAEDTELNREVALKEIQAKYADDENSRLRFLLEAEVTGGLEHPGIVPVYGLGRYDDGRPFYAMRFIKGDSLQEAADRFHGKQALVNGIDGQVPVSDFNSLEFRKLLGRFIDVCQAIEYAHSRGVLHRDLKPGNIMLGKYGETLVVDWGLAKAQGCDESDKVQGETTLRPPSASGSAPTMMGSAIGTPAFMPPEQAAGDIDRLGPASDVYSLGATLYYLLTGNPPFQGKDLTEVLERVKSGKFPSPRSVQHSAPKALAAICLKAMSLSAEDRYATPAALADEVERFLADEPVAAFREPLSLRMRRWIRKHQTVAATTVAIVALSALSLTGLAAVVTAKNAELVKLNDSLADKNLQLNLARKRAESTASQLASANQSLVEKEKQVTEERDALDQVVRFLREDLLRQASPYKQPDRDMKLITVLDRASDSLADRFNEQPAVKASLSRTIGGAYLDLGDYDQAEPHLELAHQLRAETLGPEHPDTLATLAHLAKLRFEQTDYQRSAELWERLLEVAKRDSLSSLLDSSLASLSAAYCELGRYQEAVEVGKEAIEFSRSLYGDRSPTTMKTAATLGHAYYKLGKFAEAETLLTQVLEFHRQANNMHDPEALLALNNLALLYRDQQRLDDATDMFREAIPLLTEVMGPTHPRTMACVSNLGTIHLSQGKYEMAATLFEESLRLLRETQGDDDIRTLIAMNNLASAYKRLRQFEKARPLYEEVVAGFGKKLGANHADTLVCINNLALLCETMEDLEAAEPLRRELVKLSRDSGSRPDIVGLYLANLAENLLQQEKYADAEAICTECVALAEKFFSKTWFHAAAQSLLAESLAGQVRCDESIELLGKVLSSLDNPRGRLTAKTRGLLFGSVNRSIRLIDGSDQVDATELAVIKDRFTTLEAALQE